MKYAVLTDSTADLSEAQAAEFGIHIIPLQVNFDGRIWQDHRELRSAEMFRRVATGAEIPSTSPPDSAAYRATVEELLRTHDHVVALHLSGHLSETANQAAQIAEDFPGQMTVIDTWNASAALAMQAQRASTLLQGGIRPLQVKVLLEILRPLVHTHMCLDTLDYLRKNGRIGGAAALLGNMLSLKPILGLQDGRVEAVTRVMGNQRALKQMTTLLTEYARTTPEGGRVSFFHNGNAEAVAHLQQVAAQLSLENPFNLELGVVLSAHGGPGVYGFSFEPQTIWHDYRPYGLSG